MGESMVDQVLVGAAAATASPAPESSITLPIFPTQGCWEAASPAHPTVAGPRALARRGLDLVIAVVALTFTLPLLLMISTLILLQDGGPVLWGQSRVGYGGRNFRRWKFRTTVVNAENQLSTLLDRDLRLRGEWDAAGWLRHDPRFTPLGRLLRQSRLEELPQLFNVLSGDMSIVGPRPIAGSEIGRYDRRSKYCAQVRPGITGLGPVDRREGSADRGGVVDDEMYFRHWHFGLDLAILLGSVKAGFTSDRDD